MRGIDGSLEDGLTKFKSNFNPMIEEYVGEFNLPVNMFIYKLSSKLYLLRKQLRNKR